MTTAEVRTSTTGGEAGGPTYDAFLSYSHAADDLLAPRLQAGLQRFAKPWWKRRALHVFRDEASLSANPHLWGSITEALDDSGWFILLLSPEAAESVWVDREVEWWLERKDPERIIPVVTDGEFTWADGEIQSDAAPPALHGAFSDEPRWVDLRFARSEEQLDLKNPRFSAAVADVASAIRGVPKDELESEEVRQHRRTVRTAWAATFALVVLVVVAGGAALFALDQRNEAQAERDRAVVAENAATAAAESEAEQRAEAEEQRAEAERQASLALASAQLARSRELAASAINVLDEDPELSVLLALQAAESADPAFESVSALHEALQSHRTRRTLVWPDEWPMDPGLTGGLSPDGRLVAVSGARHQLAVWDLESVTDEPIWRFEVPWPEYATVVPRFASDGSVVVANVSWFKYDEPPESWPEPPSEAGVYVIDSTSGDVLRHFRGPDCPFIALFQTGPFLDLERPVGGAAPIADDCSLVSGVELWTIDLTTGETVLAYEGPASSWLWATPASLSGDGSRLTFVADFTTNRAIDLETGTELFETAGGEYSHLSRDGSRLLAASGRVIHLWDIDSGTELWTAESPANLNAVEISADETLVYSGANDGTVRVWDARSGELLDEFKGHRAVAWFETLSHDNSTLASFSTDRTVRIWDLTPSAEGEIAGFDLDGFPVLQAGKIEGDRGAILLYPNSDSAFVEPGIALIFDPDTGTELGAFDGYGGQGVRLSPDGTLLAGQPHVAPGMLGPVHLRDVATGDVLVELEHLCTFDYSTQAPGPDCEGKPGSFGDFLWWLAFSPDGSMLAMSGETVAGVWDVETGELLAWLTKPTAEGDASVTLGFTPDSAHLVRVATQELTVFETEGWSEVATLPVDWFWWDLIFAPDGSRLIGADLTSGIVTIDTSTWEYVGEPILAHEGIIRDIALSADGSLIASAGSDGFVFIRDSESGDVLQAIPLGDRSVTLVEFLTDDHLFIATHGRPALVMTIDVDELVDIARRRVTRGFTIHECDTYRIDPCPTLEEIRGGR